MNEQRGVFFAEDVDVVTAEEFNKLKAENERLREALIEIVKVNIESTTGTAMHDQNIRFGMAKIAEDALEEEK